MNIYIHFLFMCMYVRVQIYEIVPVFCCQTFFLLFAPVNYRCYPFGRECHFMVDSRLMIYCTAKTSGCYTRKRPFSFVKDYEGSTGITETSIHVSIAMTYVNENYVNK